LVFIIIFNHVINPVRSHPIHQSFGAIPNVINLNLGMATQAAFASAIAKPKSLKSDAGVKLSQSHRPLIVGVDLRDWMTDQMETENGVSVIAYDSYSKHDIKVNMI